MKLKNIILCLIISAILLLVAAFFIGKTKEPLKNLRITLQENIQLVREHIYFQGKNKKIQDLEASGILNRMFIRLIKGHPYNNAYSCADCELIQKRLSKVLISDKSATIWDEVLEIEQSLKQIRFLKIPGMPEATHPYIIRYQDHYLMYFRHDVKLESEKFKHTKMMLQHRSLFYVVELDNMFIPISMPQLVEGDLFDSEEMQTAEDARLFYFNDQLYAIYNKSIYPTDEMMPIKRSIYISRIVKKNVQFTLTNTVRMLSPTGAMVEKNWAPLVLNNKLYLIYSIEPLIILEPNLQTGSYRIVKKSSGISSRIFGELRNTSPAVKIGSNGDYVLLLHSSCRDFSMNLFYFYFPAILSCHDGVTSCKISKRLFAPIFHRYFWDVTPAESMDPYLGSVIIKDDELILSSSSSHLGPISLYFIDKKKFLAAFDKY